MSKDLHLSDILLEFLEVAVHTILFHRKIYPSGIFSLKKKYNTPVHVSLYPDLNKYISESLKCLKQLFSLQDVKKFILSFLFDAKVMERFVVVFHKVPEDLSLKNLLSTSDPYLTQLQEGFRGFFLRTLVCMGQLNDLPKASTFRIELQTTENSSQLINEDPTFQVFPWIEAEQEEYFNEKSSILPIRTIKTDQLHLQVYYEKC